MKRVFAASLLALAIAAPVAAQRTTGEIIGRIVDESGSVLPGVTVTLRGAGVAEAHAAFQNSMRAPART